VNYQWLEFIILREVAVAFNHPTSLQSRFKVWNPTSMGALLLGLPGTIHQTLSQSLARQDAGMPTINWSVILIDYEPTVFNNTIFKELNPISKQQMILLIHCSLLISLQVGILAILLTSPILDITLIARIPTYSLNVTALTADRSVYPPR
jgi:hypothetical protein